MGSPDMNCGSDGYCSCSADALAGDWCATCQHDTPAAMVDYTCKNATSAAVCCDVMLMPPPSPQTPL
jgi:hypothetical protein